MIEVQEVCESQRRRPGRPGGSHSLCGRKATLDKRRISSKIRGTIIQNQEESNA